MEPTYVVTGYHRSGTSMAMDRVQAAGLPAYYDPARDEYLRAQTADQWYHLQGGHSVFEVSRQMGAVLTTDPSTAAGMVVKVFWPDVAKLAPHPTGYRYMFMLRDQEEIRQSFEGGFVRGRSETWMGTEGSYAKQSAYHIAGLRAAPDTLSVSLFRYREDFIDGDPVAAFRRLRADGWPIDPETAAAGVDEDLCRFRLEELEVGI